MSIVTITRKIEFDTGHRIPDHKSKCRSFHGHRYVLEASATGEVNPIRGQSDDGMVLDLGDLKECMNICVGDLWDHTFLVAESDRHARDALHCVSDTRYIVYPFIPTVENMAQYAFKEIAFGLAQRGSMILSHVRLYETPNCWADVYAKDFYADE